MQRRDRDVSAAKRLLRAIYVQVDTEAKLEKLANLLYYEKSDLRRDIESLQRVRIVADADAE